MPVFPTAIFWRRQPSRRLVCSVMFDSLTRLRPSASSPATLLVQRPRRRGVWEKFHSTPGAVPGRKHPSVATVQSNWRSQERHNNHSFRKRSQFPATFRKRTGNQKPPTFVRLLVVANIRFHIGAPHRNFMARGIRFVSGKAAISMAALQILFVDVR